MCDGMMIPCPADETARRQCVYTFPGSWFVIPESRAAVPSNGVDDQEANLKRQHRHLDSSNQRTKKGGNACQSNMWESFAIFLLNLALFGVV